MTEAAEHSDKASKLKGLLWLACGCLLAAGFALGITPLAHAIPWSWEKKMAERDAFNLPLQACTANPGADKLLDKLIRRIYPVQPGDAEFSIDVKVVRDPAINAFASLGGKLYINTGFLTQAQSADEAAGVLAHEIEHVRHRHIMEVILVRLLTSQGLSMVFGGDADSSAETADFLMRANFSRAQEAEADHDGLARLQAAHVDNSGFRKFFERLEDGGIASQFISDHPSSTSRAELAAEFDNKDAKPVMTKDDWVQVKHYCKDVPVPKKQ